MEICDKSKHVDIAPDNVNDLIQDILEILQRDWHLGGTPHLR